MVRDFKYPLAIEFDRSYRKVAETIKTDSLREAAAAFQSNVWRIEASILALPILIDFGLVVGHAGAEACVRLFGNTRIPSARAADMKPLADGSDSPLEHKLKLESMAALRDYQAKEQQQTLDSPSDYPNAAAWKRGVYNLNLWSRRESYFEGDDYLQNPVHFAVEGTLHSALLNAWTATESLATDLWLKAVNNRPHTLGCNLFRRLLGGDAPNKDGISEDADNSAMQEPTVRLSTLADYGFDLRERLGDLLKAKKRVNFDSMFSIQTAYKNAFRIPGDKKGRTSSALLEIFQKFSADLKVLEAIRNLLAHRSGIVDERFRRVAQKSAPDMNLPNGKQLLNVDGEIVRKYVDVAVRFSLALLAFVDNWLENNPDVVE